MVSVYYGQIVVACMLGEVKNEKDVELHFALVNKRARGLGLGSMCVSLFCCLCFQKIRRVLVGAEKLEVYNRRTREYEYMNKEVSPIVRFWRREGFQEITETRFGDDEHELFHFMMCKAHFEERELSMLAVTGNIQSALHDRKIAKLFPPTLTPRLPKIRLNAPWVGDYWVDCSAVARSG